MIWWCRRLAAKKKGKADAEKEKALNSKLVAEQAKVELEVEPTQETENVITIR